MRTVSAIFVATSLLATALPVASAPATAPDPATIAADMAAHPPADLDAYYRLRQQLGPHGPDDVESALSTLVHKQAGISTEGSVPACLFPAWFYDELSGLHLAREVSTDANWQQARASITAALAQRDAVLKEVMAGTSTDPTLAGANGAYKRAATITDPRLRELAERVARDQFDRLSTRVIGQHLLWAKDVTPAVAAYLHMQETAEGCRTDVSNAQWLKADLEAHGWPKISQYGQQADADAWLLVQHADQDRDFQRSVLTMLEALLPTKDTRPQSYAYLYDRVATGDKRPQRYGTQGQCTGPGTWEPFASEDPDNLDKRRAEVGLGPEADYKKGFTFCTAEMAAMSKNMQPAKTK